MEKQIKMKQGKHAGHAKGAKHYKSKKWNVWKLKDEKAYSRFRNINDYEYFGQFCSLGQIADAIDSTYMNVYAMKYRWENLMKGNPGVKSVAYRIEEAI